jgi:hypothetical protein
MRHTNSYHSACHHLVVLCKHTLLSHNKSTALSALSSRPGPEDLPPQKQSANCQKKHPLIVTVLSSFDIQRVLEHGALLLSSGGQEYDSAPVGGSLQERLAQQRQNLKRRLGEFRTQQHRL